MFRRTLRNLVPLLAVLVLLVPVSAHAIPKSGQPLPQFDVTTPSGQRVTNQNYTGRVLLLIFSTDYCTACKSGIPEITRLAGRYGKQGFHVLGLLSGFGMDDDDLKEYMKSYQVTYPMALFEQKFASEQFGVLSVPYSLLVNKKGMIAGIYRGISDATMKQIEGEIKKLLAE